MAATISTDKNIFTISNIPEPFELRYMAYSGQFEKVRNFFKRIPEERWEEYADRYILHQTIWGGIEKIHRLLAASQDAAAHSEKEFVEKVMRLFIDSCHKKKQYPREFFQGLLFWSDELTRLSLLDEALRYCYLAINSGSNKFPEIHCQFQARIARIAIDSGKFSEAQGILSELISKPFLIPDRNLIPDLLFDFGQASLLNDRLDLYKQIQFLGLRFFYTDFASRERFAQQLSVTYRRFYRLIFHPDVRLPNKCLYLLHWTYFKLSANSLLNKIKLPLLLKPFILGYVFLLNYALKDQSARLINADEPPVNPRLSAAANSNGKPVKRPAGFLRKQNFLVTRAMGGIGDLLMMTPGFHALKKKYPDQTIYLSIPKRYFAVFENNPDVTLVDIETTPLFPQRYRRWFNFSDCPAARSEAVVAPRVKKSRIDIFAGALGIGFISRRQMNTRPRYFISPEEAAFAESFWNEHDLNDRPVIGLQLFADESYRNYPHNTALIEQLARNYKVLLFDAKPIPGYEHPNIIKIDCYSLRKAFALAGRCQLIIAPDSAFVHLSGALELPCIALFGPIDGKVRTRQYPTVEYLDARKELGCVPCWRNEVIPCKLTGLRNSVCMSSISVERIVAKVKETVPDTCIFAGQSMKNSKGEKFFAPTVNGKQYEKPEQNM